MPIKATDLKRGNALIWEGQLHVVIGTEHKARQGPGVCASQDEERGHRHHQNQPHQLVRQGGRCQYRQAARWNFSTPPGPNGPWVLWTKSRTSKSSWTRIWSVIRPSS